MRISDWSSDVCSSDLDIFVERQFGFLPYAGILGVARFAFLLIGLRFLRSRPLRLRQQRPVLGAWLRRSADGWRRQDQSHQSAIAKIACLARAEVRKSVVWGKSVAVRLDHVGSSILKTKRKDI